MKLGTQKKGVLYALLASLIWSIVNPFIKQGLSYGIPPITFAGLRFSIVGVILILYTCRRGLWHQVRENKKLFTMIILLNIFLGYAFFYWGVDLVPSVISSIVMGLVPLINVLMAHFLANNDKIDRHKIISMSVSLIGLILVLDVGGSQGLDWKGYLGVLCLLLCILSQGYASILVADSGVKIDPVFMNAVQMLFGGITLYAVGVGVHGHFDFFGQPTMFYGCLSTLVAVSLFAYNLWFMALQAGDTKVSEINICRLVTPTIGAILSWIMIPDEEPTVKVVMGMIILLGSMAYFFRGPQREKLKQPIAR